MGIFMRKKFLYVFLVFITLLLIINPQASVKYARSGLEMAEEIIIPSLFPFFVCSGLLIYSGFCEVLAKYMQPIMKPLFNVNGAGAAAFVLGIISGYPLGAVTVCALFEKSYLSKSEAERMLAFCNNSGPLFILGAVGISLYQNPRVGIVLYISHILAAVLTGIAFGFYKKNSYNAPRSGIGVVSAGAGEVFSTVLASSVQSILTVCGAVVFFSVISSLITDMLPIAPVLKMLVTGFMEFVTGVKLVAYSQLPMFEKLVLSAAIVGFAGMSVHIQVLGVVSRSGLDLKPYIVGKCIQGVLAAVITACALRLFPVGTEVFAPASLEIGGAFAMNSLFVIMSAASIVFFVIAGGVTVICKRRFVKNELKEKNVLR